MNYYKQLPILFAFFIFLTNNAFAQQEKVEQIDSLIKWSNNIGLFNGNVLVVENGKTIYKASYGYTDVSGKIKLNESHRFNIGSISKEFSAVSIMKLQEQGKLKLEDSISKFIPELPKWANNISIKNILQYTSGLPDLNLDKVNTINDVLNDLKLLDTLLFQPGTSYKYSNINFVLQQIIIERVTKMQYNSYAEKYLFKPCKMNFAKMNPLNNEKNIAKSFNDESVEFPISLSISGVVYATTDDVLKWSNCLCSEKVINKQSLAQIGVRFNLANAQAGLGITTFDNKVLIAFQHDGSAYNYRALLYSNLQENTAIILLENNGNEKIFEIASAIKAILNGEKYDLPKKYFFIQFKKELDSLTINEFICFYNNIKTLQSNIYDVGNETTLNSIGYYLMSNQRLDDAIEIFNLNIQLFPVSSNVYDSMGEAFYNQGNLKSAILNYNKSFELNPQNINAKQMIEKITKIRQQVVMIDKTKV